MADVVRQVVKEELAHGTPSVHLSQLLFELLAHGSPNVKIAQLCIEVIFPYTPPVSPGLTIYAQAVT